MLAAQSELLLRIFQHCLRSGLLCIVLVPGIALAQQQNPVVVENAKAGTDSWKLNNSANDSEQQIKGYASATSINKGQSIKFHVNVNRTQTYQIDVYRMGWYNGNGGRLLTSIGPLNGEPQSGPIVDSATGMVSYQWTPGYTLAIPNDWTSGIYLAKLTNADGFENYISFVVRDDSRSADFLYQQPVTTYQAYNPFPRVNSAPLQTLSLGQKPNATSASSAAPVPDTTSEPSEIGNPQRPDAAPPQQLQQQLQIDNADVGKSLYEYNSSPATTGAGTTRALSVSFDRPYEGWGDGQFFSWEVYLVRWLEREGYDVAYATNIDTHRQGAALLGRYRGFISAGHDEYWTKAMYDAADSARDGGVNLAFMGSNAVYWQIRLAAGASGAADRTIISYKDIALDPIGSALLKTTRWRDVDRAEQVLVGVQYITDNEWEFNTDFIVSNTDHWVYAGTGLVDGDSIAGITGYEVDTLYPDYPKPDSTNQTLLSASPFTGRDGTNAIANASVYQAPSGAWVFATGTMTWPWALERDGFIDERIRTAMRNILQRFTAEAPTNQDLIDTNFDIDTSGFSYTDDTFRSTSNYRFANGYPAVGRGYGGTGNALAVLLGSTNESSGIDMSGGWQNDFLLDSQAQVTLSMRYALSQTPDYEPDELSEVLLSIDGRLVGTSGNDYIARIVGDGDGGDYVYTNWQQVEIDLGTLAPGRHRIVIGGFSNKSDDQSERTEILIDDLRVASVGP